MTCDQIERDEIAEQYVAGKLAEADQQQFEAHYFDCPSCLERLRVLESARAELSRKPAGRSRAWWFRGAAGLAVAAVIVLAVRVLQEPGSQPPADPGAGPSRSGDVTLPAPPSVPPGLDLRALSHVEPPRYAPPRLRGTMTRAQREFRDAMEAYAVGDWASAAPGLRRAIALDNSLVQAHFFLAVCMLQGEATDDAVQHLQHVIAFGESAYLADARFFLAKAHLRQGDIPAARSELTSVIALGGERRQEATELLAKLP